SMVHGLASQLGGALTIESALGVGTTIELWLPVSNKLLEAIEDSAQSRPNGGMKGQVLLVEDEDVVRTSTADMLQDMGFDVVEAASAEQAMRLLEGGLGPDLVVTDHLMPGMHGAELAETVLSAYEGTKVLIVSG
ncbi:response regulator, partial [Escherichia coli]|uniref:response regulator n=1 Tax=Escherichia coli TaxID=562 RepID=UPI0013037B1F